MMMPKILRVFKGEKSAIPPIWLMRQAGRYLPEYMKIRQTVSDFLEFCYSPEKAAEVTMQPIRRFDFDATIIFSDILVIPDMLGLGVKFMKGEGPLVEVVSKIDDLKKLKTDENSDKIKKVCETISIVKSKLPNDKALIGFAGAPWTVATYILEGKGNHKFIQSRKIAYHEPRILDSLIDKIIDQTILYLRAQIKAGVDIIQIFDSWAGVLASEDYEKYIIKPNKKIISVIKKEFPHIPIIGFPKGSGHMYESYISETGVNGISIDHEIPPSIMKSIQKKLVVQGNLDPVILLGKRDIVKERVENILNNMKDNEMFSNFIFNLGHGILPETPIENVEELIKTIRSIN